LAYPWHLANCGDLDICCRPRAQSFYRQILWGYRASPWIGVHRPNAAGSKPGFTFWGWGDVHHSWSWPGCEGFKVYIDVYSQCDEVELFLNGSSLGRKPAGKAASNVASFETCYRPGILKAVAYSGGLPAFEDTVTACGEPAAIQLDADREGIPAAWGGLAFVSAEIVDDNGNIVPYANHKLYFTVSGPGGILAVGNSDPKSEEPYVGNIRSAYNGMALAILNSNGIPGEIDLTVSADGLKTAQITLVAKE
jgi:beta-galactosidase